MYYPQYFKLGQGISLKRVFLDPAKQNQTDILSGQIASCDSSSFIIHFPHNANESHATYPFFPGMPFTIHSEYHGLGIQVSVSFEERLTAGLIRLVPAGDLNFYYTREHPRAALQLWLGCQRENESLLTMRRQWRRHVNRFQSESAPSSVNTYAKQKIELGDDGINLELDAPVKVPELSLVYLALNDGKPLICALAEVVWAEPTKKDKKQRAGLHFINILDDDRKRIQRYIKDALT